MEGWKDGRLEGWRDMKNRHSLSLAAIILALSVTSCATLRTYEANLGAKPKGVRIYGTKVYLFVDGEKGRSHLVQLPDFKRAYDLQPVAILAKHEFKAELEGGRLLSLTSKQDPTAFLTFLSDAAALGATAAGASVSKDTMDGTFGMPPGIYLLTDDGRFELIQGPPGQ